ncbi:acyl-CoA synthetase family protein [Blattabacterium cuenoti]|uniref:o-succinylbenzoate--CoA ligase n=1 Tax=Blattabacterium cuenoti TaxID=1653831 RepID=UPI00163CC312|nr:o-succinylbenzoate--CoA ligase [Blattabacterium cuenoti]
MEHNQFNLNNGILIDFKYNKIFTKIVDNTHHLYSWKESILSFINIWNNPCTELINCTSSGTTGIKKNIVLNKKYIYDSANSMVQFLKLNRTNILGLLCLSPEYIASKIFLIRSIIFKWKIYCIPPSSNPLQNIATYFDISSMVPMQVLYSIKELYKIQILLIGGTEITRNLEKKLQTVSTSCYHTYGLTETAGAIAIRKANGLNKSNYYTLLLNNINLKLDYRNCLKINYDKMYYQTSIQTNDIVNLLYKNEFIWIGRYDNIINSGGIKISPEVVEKQISYYIPDKKFIISSIPDKILGEKLILLIEGSYCDLKIPHYFFTGYKKYWKPKHIYFIQNFLDKFLIKFKRKNIREHIIKMLKTI